MEARKAALEVRATWKERPTWFAPGMIHWVAIETGAGDERALRESPVFPIDADFVSEDHPDEDNEYVRVDRERMDDETRRTVETMHAEFVASLERDGWVRAGQGRDWDNTRLERWTPAAG